MEHHSIHNVSVVLFATFGSLFTGYSLAVIYSSLNLSSDTTSPSYNHTTTIIGAANGLGDKLGRVNGFRVASTIGFIGAAIQTGGVNQAIYLVGRSITGVATTGQLMVAMPTYYSEVAPPHFRGLMAGAHGMRLKAVPETDLLLTALLISSSLPHHLDGDFQTQHLLFGQHETDNNLIRNHGPWQLFTIPTYRRRIILGLMLVAGGQNIGVLVINNYNTLLYKSLGLSSMQALAIGAAYNTWAAFANVGGAFVSNRLGKRKALLIGYSGAIVMFIIATGLIAKYSENSSKSCAAAAVTFLFLYVYL
ncbi:MFS general substrate transporter [Acephala macrosclerotiorum]|nr:MFS general substrate transporter [Acephala macrosclerotiorum]